MAYHVPVYISYICGSIYQTTHTELTYAYILISWSAPWTLLLSLLSSVSTRSKKATVSSTMPDTLCTTSATPIVSTFTIRTT